MDRPKYIHFNENSHEEYMANLEEYCDFLVEENQNLEDLKSDLDDKITRYLDTIVDLKSDIELLQREIQSILS